ncbi:hypothetical protein [Amnibacterium kyonggiense]|uniref:hypothetical protein n=1 Tax=Amnibacterium kyonggiense TaxID=595671 RepID=UPI0013C2DCC0|nr:hypothetical protein [Amnibacterium kyonggiense]
MLTVGALEGTDVLRVSRTGMRWGEETQPSASGAAMGRIADEIRGFAVDSATVTDGLRESKFSDEFIMSIRRVARNRALTRNPIGLAESPRNAADVRYSTRGTLSGPQRADSHPIDRPLRMLRLVLHRTREIDIPTITCE